MQEAGGEHLPGFVLVGGRHDQHIGDAAQVAEVEAAGVGRAVFADQAGAVDGEEYVQVLYRDIMDQLIVGALQEGRIDSHHRFGAFAGHAGSEGDGMLFGDGDVEIASREAFAEGDQVRAFLHGRGDADQSGVGLGHVAQPLAEDIGVLRLARAAAAGLGLQLGDGVVADGVGFGGGEALALLGDHMQELRALELAHVAQRGDQGRQVVPVDGADIVPAQLFEQHARCQHGLGGFFGLAGQFPGRWNLCQDLLAAFTHMRIGATGENLGQVVGQAADVMGDRHVVVVQYHQHVGIDYAGVVERFEGHAGGHGAVADDGHRAAIQALQAGGDGHAQAGADRGAGMADAEGVEGAFAAPREGRNAVLLPQAGHLFAATGEDLVRIGLMAHVPQQPVLGSLIDVMQRDCQLDDPEPGTEVTAGLADGPQQEQAQLVRQFRQLRFVEVAQLVDGVEAVQQRSARTVAGYVVESARHQTRL